MKNFKALSVLLILVFIISTGCSLFQPDYVGTWGNENGKYVFEKNSYKVIIDGQTASEGTLENNGDKLILTDNNTGESVTFTYSVDGDKITLSNGQGTGTLTKE